MKALEDCRKELRRKLRMANRNWHPGFHDGYYRGLKDALRLLPKPKRPTRPQSGKKEEKK